MKIPYLSSYKDQIIYTMRSTMKLILQSTVVIHEVLAPINRGKEIRTRRMGVPVAATLPSRHTRSYEEDVAIKSACSVTG